ncbi:MAG TPA: FUSC family membrane protein, partial [Burkholderiaceae bacterium]|nr:FUSC family membrane protein [Burkholderiaceae bacterium]
MMQFGGTTRDPTGGSIARQLARLPARAVNGLSVGLGVGGIIAVVAGLGGLHAALLASSGAVFGSIADMPTTPSRVWKRVLACAATGCGVALLVALLRPYPMALGVAIALIAFCSAMALSWGTRAGPLSFVGILALVFTMAGPVAAHPALVLLPIGWNLLGAGLYLGWSVLSSVALQRLYRKLAVAAVVESTADLIRARAQLIRGAAAGADDDARQLQRSIRDDAELADRLQAARDLLFVAPDTEANRRLIALLLRLIDLRDLLLASRLDLDVLGTDRFARRVRARLALGLRRMASALDQVREALRSGVAPRNWSSSSAHARLDAVLRSDAAVDPRSRAVPMLATRLRQMADEIARMHGLVGQAPGTIPLPRSELSYFVSPDRMSFAAWRPHFTLRSPVLRHALRASLATVAAYAIGRSLPWASHPHWLVLSVAVVLRGNLEQTLSRRNARVTGTALGCVLVLLLSHLHEVPLLAGLFVLAVAAAHTFALSRYLLTSVAASVMALLQPHLLDPYASLAVGERLADTVIGAALAWGFSYVLPAWERRTLPRTVIRVLAALDAHAREVLQWPTGGPQDVAQRRARRDVYDALGALAGAAQRTSVEPRRVRLPLRQLSNLLTEGYRILGHLALVKSLLARRAAELDRPRVEAILQAAARAVHQELSADVGAAGPAPGDPDALPPGQDDGPELPREPSAADALPWLSRRLEL